MFSLAALLAGVFAADALNHPHFQINQARLWATAKQALIEQAPEFNDADLPLESIFIHCAGPPPLSCTAVVQLATSSTVVSTRKGQFCVTKTESVVAQVHITQDGQTHVQQNSGRTSSSKSVTCPDSM